MPRDSRVSSTRTASAIDRFVADLDQEYYDHFAGLKQDFDLDSIYERYADITTSSWPGACRARSTAAFRSTELWRFACEGYLGTLTRRHEEDDGEARGDADGDGRRRGDPVPDAAAGDREQRRPATAASGSSACATS